MNARQAQALVERQARAWERADLQAIGADYAPDACFISPGGTWWGPDAIRAAAAAFFEASTEVQVTITRIVFDEAHGAVEWTWSETRRVDGRRFSVEDAIIFGVRGDQIVDWREYFDTAAMK
jgi:uncharacterized protein (TIGR02246 family)